MKENLQNPEINVMKRVNTLHFELPSVALGPVGRLGPQSIVIGPAIETVLTAAFCLCCLLHLLKNIICAIPESHFHRSYLQQSNVFAKPSTVFRDGMKKVQKRTNGITIYWLLSR